MSDVIPLLTEKEAAAILRISPRSLLTLRQRGEVPAVRLGHRVFYHLDVLKGWSRDRGRCEAPPKEPAEKEPPEAEYPGLVVLDDGTVGTRLVFGETEFVFVVAGVAPVEGGGHG